MPVNRFYTPQPLKENALISLEGAEFLHMTKALRSKSGQSVEVCNGMGALAQGKIEEIQKKKATLRITSAKYAPPSQFKIILAQALPRINRLDTIIEKATELGADEILLFPGDLSERKQLTEHQMERLVQITVSAMKQCGRLYLPLLKQCPPLSEWQTIPSPSFFGDPDASQSFSKAWKTVSPQECATFCVGPESGFSEEELSQLVALGAKGVTLHPNVLRADTAPIVALSLISQFLAA